MIAVAAVLATIIAIVLLSQTTNPTTTAAPGATPTFTPAPTQPPRSPSPTPSPAPTVAVGTPVVPSKVELAANSAACAPFAKAGNQPQGAGKWGAAPKQVLDKSKTYTARIFTTYGVVTANIEPKLGRLLPTTLSSSPATTSTTASSSTASLPDS